MLSDLLQIRQGLLLPPHNGGHSAHGRPLELLATEERVAKLEQADIVLGDLRNEVAGSVELAKGELVVVLVVQDIQEGGKERVQVLLGLAGLLAQNDDSRREWGTRR